MAQVLLRLEDILVRHRDDIAARIADGLYHLLERFGFVMRMASAIVVRFGEAGTSWYAS